MYLNKTQHARYQRQWRFLSKQLKKLTEKGQFQSFTETKKAHLIGRLKSLFQKMLRFEKASSLKKALGAAALLLGLQATPLQAQVEFAPEVNNPFGLVHSGNLAVNTLADIDGDGDLDILTVQYDYNTETHTFDFRENASENDGTLPSFLPVISDYLGVTFPDAAARDFSGLDLVDIDNDGDLDLFVGDYDTDDSADTQGRLIYFENIGDANNPAFANPVLDPFNIDITISTNVSPSFADMDNDGDLDFINVRSPFGFYGINTFTYFENIGTPEVANFAAPQETPFGLPDDFGEFGVFDMGDIDHDGDLDILTGDIYDFLNYEPATFKFFENVGTATVPQFSAPVESPFSLQPLDGFLIWPALGDLDNDGDLDILTDGGYDYDTYEPQWTFHENLLDPVAVKEPVLAAQATVFPTISNSFVTLNVETEAIQSYFQINVFDVTGELLSRKELAGGSVLNEKIDLNAYPAGQYLVQVRTSEGVLTRKLIKQ